MTVYFISPARGLLLNASGPANDVGAQYVTRFYKKKHVGRTDVDWDAEAHRGRRRLEHTLLELLVFAEVSAAF